MDTLNKRKWDGTGAGIGHGDPVHTLVDKINELVAHANSQDGSIIAAGAPTELTLDTNGAFTLTGAFHTVDTFGDAGTDNADTIDGLTQGSLFVLQPASGARTVVFRHGIDNIVCLYGKNISMADANDIVLGFSPDGTTAVLMPVGILAADGGGAGAIIGLLSSLTTATSASVVAAINELVTRLGSTTAATVAGTGVALTSTSEGGVKKLLVTFTNTPIPLTDEAGVVAYGGLKVLDLPEGHILFMGAVADLALTKSSAGVNADWDGDISLGSATASNNSTLSGTEQDYIPSTSTPQAVAGATTGDMASTSTEACKVFDGHATAKDVYLNVLVDDTDHNVAGTPCNIIVNGTLTFSYLLLGDN